MTTNLIGWQHGNIELMADLESYERYTGAHRLIERLVNEGRPRDLATATAKEQYGHPRVAVFLEDDAWDDLPNKHQYFTGPTRFMRLMLGEATFTPDLTIAPHHIPLPYSIYEIADGTADLGWLISASEVFRIFGLWTAGQVNHLRHTLAQPASENISLIG